MLGHGRAERGAAMKLMPWLGAAFVVTCCSGLIAQAPASLLADPVSRQTGGRLQLADVKGLAWQGAARLVCRLPDGNAECGRIAWKVDTQQLWHGSVALNVSMGSAGDVARIALTPFGWSVENVQLTLPAALIGSAHEKIAALGLGGFLQISGKNITPRSGAMQIHWHMASSRLIPGALLGEHRMDITLAPEGKTIGLSSQQGPLTLSGGGKLANDGMLQLDVTAAAAPGDKKLGPLLAMLGKETAANTYRMQLPSQ